MNFSEYKNSGVYLIRNKITNQEYVGSSAIINKRFCYHRNRLLNKKHPNPKLQRSYDKYGAEAFEYVVVFNCDREGALDLEQEMIDSGDYYYNISPIARRPQPVIRKVLQYGMDGKFIKEHESLADAAREVGGSSQGIYHACKGLANSCKGYRWTYVSENEIVNIGAYKTKHTPRGPFRYIKNYRIDKFSKDGVFLQSYYDVYSLCKSLRYTIEDFRKHLHGKGVKVLRGYIFKLEAIDE